MADDVTSLFEPPEPVSKAPRAWLAALLGAAVPGSGQLYVGRPARAAVVSVIAVLWPALALYLATSLHTAETRLAAISMALLLLVILSGVDAWHIARGTAPAPTPWWRRWYAVAGYAALVLVAARPLAGLVTPSLIQIYRVDGPAMSLTLQSGDRVVATPLTGQVRPRMVVVWRTSDGTVATHRVVGMPRDRIEMRNFRLLVNGVDIEGSALRAARWIQTPAGEFAWQREYLDEGVEPDRYRPTYGDWGPLRVPEGRYFVLGDNRYGSRDSRHHGFVAREQVMARVRWIVFSTDEKTREVRLERMGHDVS